MWEFVRASAALICGRDRQRDYWADSMPMRVPHQQEFAGCRNRLPSLNFKRLVPIGGGIRRRITFAREFQAQSLQLPVRGCIVAGDGGLVTPRRRAPHASSFSSSVNGRVDLRKALLKSPSRSLAV